jgi:hypothetical protein
MSFIVLIVMVATANFGLGFGLAVHFGLGPDWPWLDAIRPLAPIDPRNDPSRH